MLRRVVICRALGYGAVNSIEKLDTSGNRSHVARGITVFRQDKAGAVHIDIRDGGYEVKGFLNGQTFRGNDLSPQNSASESDDALPLFLSDS